MRARSLQLTVTVLVHCGCELNQDDQDSTESYRWAGAEAVTFEDRHKQGRIAQRRRERDAMDRQAERWTKTTVIACLIFIVAVLLTIPLWL